MDGNRGSVENGLGQSLGIKHDHIGQLLAMLAPVIMGALGKARKQQGFDAGALARTLGQERSNLHQKMPSGLGGLFDADGGLLEKLFGGR